MEKLYSVLITVEGAHVVEFNIVNETTGAYHIHGVNGKRVIRKEDIGKPERVSDNSFRTMCLELDVEQSIEAGYNQLLRVLSNRLASTENMLNQMREDHTERTFVSVDLDGQDHYMDYQAKFPE